MLLGRSQEVVLTEGVQQVHLEGAGNERLGQLREEALQASGHRVDGIVLLHQVQAVV